MSSIDSIVFDLDGTLWDSNEACAKAWNRVARRNNILFREVTADDLRSVTGLPHPDCIRNVFIGVSERDLRILIEGTETEDNIAVAEFGGVLYPGVADGLRQLSQHYPLFIVSNCQSGYIETFLQQHNLKDLFKDFECWGKTGKSKCDNLRDLVLRNNLRRPVYVGDTNGDQLAAEENRIPFWFVSYGFGKCTKAEMQFDTFGHLTKAALQTRSSLSPDIQIEEILPVDFSRLKEIGKLRLNVWRKESRVNESMFPDGLWIEPLDHSARHWVAKDAAGIVAAARLTIHDLLMDNPDGYLFENAKLRVNLPCAHLCKLIVDNRARGKGIASELNRIRIEAAWAMGAKSILVTASEKNSRLLERLGFVDTGIRESFPNRPGYEFVAMQKDLEQKECNR